MLAKNLLFAAFLPLGLLAACSGEGDTETDDQDVTQTPSGDPSEAEPSPSESNADDDVVSPPAPGDEGPADDISADDAPTDDDSAGDDTPASSTLVLEASASSNYSFSSTLDIDVTTVAPSTNLTFDWSGLATDFLGHDVDPLADVDMITLLLWKLNEAELEQKLNADELSQSDMVALVMIYPDEETMSGEVFDMTSFGLELEQETILGYLDPETYDPATHTYTLMVVTGTTAGEGTRMIQGFRLDPASDNTHIDVTTESTLLDYTVDLSSLVPLQVPPGSNDVEVDWSNMTETALGTEFIPTSITEALVAKYALPRADLEASFLDLELIADEMYRGEILSGSSVHLSTLADAEGNAFTGVDTDGTWVVALFCGSCANPAPWYLSVLEAQ